MLERERPLSLPTRSFIIGTDIDMDATLTPPLLPNSPITNPPLAILMTEDPPSYKDIAVGKILTPSTYSRSFEFDKDKALIIDDNEILLSKENKHRLYGPGFTLSLSNQSNQISIIITSKRN